MTDVDPEQFRLTPPHREFEELALRQARVADGEMPYAMDDPKRPFTEEYDPPKAEAPAAPPTEPESAPTQPPELGPKEAFELKLAGTLERVGVIKRQRNTQAELELAQPEDPHRSLGGGRESLEKLGYVPVRGEITRKNAHGRGGRRVVRLVLKERFVDIPDIENPSPGYSLADEIEKGKELLRRRGGGDVRSLNRRKAK